MEFYNLVSKCWMNKYIYWWITVLYSLFNIIPISTLNWRGKKFWLICLVLFVCYCFLLRMIYVKRRFPKFLKEDYGILFAIVVENEAEFALINKQFVHNFQIYSERCFPGIKTKMLNVYTSKRFDDFRNDKEKIRDLAQKNNYKFIIYGNSVFGSEQEELHCKLTIEGVYNAHKGMPFTYHTFLMQEMNTLWLKVKDIEIHKKTTTHDFEDTSKQIELVFQYILGMTHLLCEEYEKSNEIFLRLNVDLQKYEKNIPVVDELKKLITVRIAWSYELSAGARLKKYYQNKNKDDLLIMKKYIDASEQYLHNQYHNNILLSIFHFLYNRNLREAMSLLEFCKGESDLTWKQNLAFLKLYSSDSVANFLYAYKVYSKLNSNDVLTLERAEELTEFICMVIEEEPEKKQLYFILFLIYYYIGNYELSDEYYLIFSNHYAERIVDDRMRSMLYKLGKAIKVTQDESEESHCAVALIS